MKIFQPLMTGYFSQPGIRKAIVDRKISVSSGIIFFMLAAIALFVLSVWFKGKNARIMSDQAVAPANSTDSPLTFRQTLIADGKTEDGFRYSLTQYKASDCVPISYEVTFLNSTARAHDELRKEIEKTSEVLEHNPENDEKGNIVGERYVANFVGSDQAKPHSAIVVTRDSDLISITSTSLKHALEFEKALKTPNNRSAFPALDPLSDVSFKSAGTTDGVNSDGIRFVRKEFTSSDCETLFTETKYFSSPETAEQALAEELKHAADVSEQGEKMNSAGQRVGKRAVAYFEAAPSSGRLGVAKVLWTEGAVLHSIEGTYTYALQFEVQQKQLGTIAHR